MHFSRCQGVFIFLSFHPSAENTTFGSNSTHTQMTPKPKIILTHSTLPSDSASFCSAICSLRSGLHFLQKYVIRSGHPCPTPYSRPACPAPLYPDLLDSALGFSFFLFRHLFTEVSVTFLIEVCDKIRTPLPYPTPARPALPRSALPHSAPTYSTLPSASASFCSDICSRRSALHFLQKYVIRSGAPPGNRPCAVAGKPIDSAPVQNKSTMCQHMSSSLIWKNVFFQNLS